ncbi:MAG: biopolymer transporter ExbD [Colwellia sp.]|uniref:ExbD/TolR family protein n=1 Tax=Colwellia sp. TaxID=56799 RepID=UPI001DE8117C|nr:biopolymer transporter ExbD [Colwellia sp.]NQY48022.1 biopolymer transporter ExbD [Colwellia sp.]
MSARKARSEVENSEVDMTPMLDIVFILLIFFIVTTSFVKEEGIMVNRPKINKPQSQSTPAMVLRISDSGMVTFNGKPVDIERVPARIENFIAKNDSSSAIVIPNYNTRHEDVVAVIDKVREFEHLTISIGK